MSTIFYQTFNKEYNMSIKLDDKFNERVVTMAKTIKENMEFDTTSGIGSEKEGAKLYEKCLPDDLSIETINKVTDHNANFIAAGSLAFGEMVVDHMKKDKKMDSASATIKMSGGNKVEYSVDRQKQYVNRIPGSPNNGETINKYGVVTTHYTVKGGHNSGALKEARKTIEEYAAEALGKL